MGTAASIDANSVLESYGAELTRDNCKEVGVKLGWSHEKLEEYLDDVFDEDDPDDTIKSKTFKTKIKKEWEQFQKSKSHKEEEHAAQQEKGERISTQADEGATNEVQDQRMQSGHENHVAAFGSQNLEQIMQDYSEESVLVTYNKANGESCEHCGIAAIRKMFEGTFKAMTDLSTFEAIHNQVYTFPNGNAFLVWKCPSSHVEYATDTFIFDQNGKIRFQTFVGWFGKNLVAPENEQARVVSVPPKSTGVIHDHWNNHFSAFGAQDVEKILKDYNEQSVVVVHEKASNKTTEYRGLADIRQCFKGLFSILSDLSSLAAPYIRVEEGDFPSVFLIWQCPSSGIVSATDTFVFDTNGIISYQKVVVYAQ
jgi:ketosteroid isomerase-like protein